MTAMSRPLARLGILLIVCAIVTIAGCTVGPFEIAWRNPEPDDTDLAETVTAVLATNTQIAIYRTSTAVSQPVSTSQPPISAATQPPVISPDQIMLIYSEDVFTLLNIAGFTVDISGLSFTSNTGNLMVSAWDNGFLTASLYAFPAGDCLMAWQVGNGDYPRPDNCGTRHAWLAVSNSAAFWTSENGFEVLWQGQPLFHCRAEIGSCAFTLP